MKDSEIFDAGLKASEAGVNLQTAYETILAPILDGFPVENSNAIFVLFHRGWMSGIKADINSTSMPVYSTYSISGIEEAAAISLAIGDIVIEEAVLSATQAREMAWVLLHAAHILDLAKELEEEQC